MKNLSIEDKINDSLISPDKILFFDLDDTLVDTKLANFLAYNKAIKSTIKSKINLEYNPNIRFNRSILRNTFPNLSESIYEKIILEKENNFLGYLDETKLIQECVEILNKYFKTNKTVLVTNCRKDRAISILNYHNLKNNFCEFFFREPESTDKKNNKFQNAISKLCIPANVIIAFENEESEINDAKEAGIKIINPKIK